MAKEAPLELNSLATALPPIETLCLQSLRQVLSAELGART